MAMPGSQAMGLYPEVRQFQLPCSYKRYLELVSFWRNDMSDKERKKLLNFSPSELELALRATAMPKMHPRFKDFLGKLVSAGGVEPFQTYIKQVFASLFSVPVKKYNPQKPVGTPMGAMQNSPFAHICITDMGLMARVPGEVAVAISTEFMNKSGLLPVPPAWLLEMSKKQDELYAGKPARPYVCQLEADIVSTRIVYFLECYQVLFYLFLKLDRLNWKKTNKSELLPFLVPNDEDQLKAAVFSKFYKWGKKDVKAAREKQQAMMEELKEKEKQHAAAVAASDPMAPADATVGQEEQQLLDALAEMKLDDSSDYVPSTALYKMLDEFPERAWTDADKGKEFKGTVFAKHADVLFGRKPPPTEAEVEARNQKFLQEMADPNSEFNKRLRAQQAHGHGGHGHNHGGHGHNHGGHGGHGGHGHNHGASSSHGHSHGGKPCHGHGPKSPPQHGHSHGGKPCHGHGPAQPAQHGHSHGGKPCHGHGPAVFTPPKQGVCGRMGCGTSKEKMARCAKCGTPYCSRECQIIDWKKHGHRQRCAALQQLKNTAK